MRKEKVTHAASIEQKFAGKDTIDFLQDKQLTRTTYCWYQVATQSLAICRQLNDVCPICLDEFQEKKMIKINCGHLFHSQCIEQWITVNARCPVCRKRL